MAFLPVSTEAHVKQVQGQDFLYFKYSTKMVR